MVEKLYGLRKQVSELVHKRKIGKKFWDESKKTWHIALPAILTAVTQFSIDAVTAAFVGHLGDVELAAVSEVQNVVEGFVYGVMLGMGSALETLCGQAVGAGRFNMLGIYMQRSWIISGVTALSLTPVYVFTSPILKGLRQNKDISELAGKFALWVIPQLFAYAFNFPMQKFLQSQSKVWVMTILSVVSLALHVFLNWVLVIKLNQGLLGAAMAGNISWWVLIIAQMIYIISGYFPVSWTGFSWLAFKSLKNFIKLSLASAIMLCLEVWYFTAIILMVGGLKDAAIAVDAVSICMNLQLWTLMVALGFNASVRLATSLNNENGGCWTLAGVAVGAGWQSSVAWLNIVCYYVIGLPIGAVLGYKLNLGVQGIWWAMLGGSLLQTIVLLIIIIRTNWLKESLQAEDRMREWGGPTEPQPDP